MRGDIYDGSLQQTNDYRDRPEIERYAILCESVRRREAIIKAVSWIKELSIDSDAIDSNPWLLCVKMAGIPSQRLLESEELTEKHKLRMRKYTIISQVLAVFVRFL